MPELRFITSEDDAGERIDSYLSGISDFSRTRIQKLIDDDRILVNGNKVKANYRIKGIEEILLSYDEVPPMQVLPQKMDLDIVYEDEDLLVINKPKGMVVHPAVGHHDQTLVNGLLYHSESLSGVNGMFRPGIVHRLDKDTSGLLVCAKNDEAHVFLSEQLADKRCYRSYYALVEGIIPHDEGEINAPIARDKKDRQKMAVAAGGKESLTLFKVLERFADSTLVECELKTGRTHQIRVHMSYIGFPVVNDPKYGKKKPMDDSGQYLHAYKLSFIHPRTKERMTFTTELPEYFKAMIESKRAGNGQ
ncbi:MAG: RluA family pseudouridine synthase [Erysipelotrichaceae bacterium]|nr:RluA family pseudouridine synthase [Erysipelotrichaceae bacterium]